MSLAELFFGFKPETIAKHPECFEEPDSDGPSDGRRTVPMEVLSLGLPRTGTASMQAALTILGIQTYHGFHSFAKEHYPQWITAYETKYFGHPSPGCPRIDRKFFDKVIGDYGAVTDTPTASFPDDLINSYPEAKVVLVVRDEKAWYKSWEDVVISAYESTGMRIAAWLDPRRTGTFMRYTIRGLAQGQFRAESGAEFRRNSVPVYRDHREIIRRILKERGEEHRLLEYRLGDGWEPLCNFLGKPIPAGVEFPRVNETAMIQEKLKVIQLRAMRETAKRWLNSYYTFFVGLAVLIWATRNLVATGR